MSPKRFVTEEKISEIHENWLRSSLQISPDGRQFGFIYLPTRGEYRVKVNHKQSPTFDAIEQFQFAPDSQSYAYAAKSGDKYRVIWQDQPGADFNFIAPDTLVFSANGQHIAYGALTGETWQLVKDNQIIQSYDNTDILKLLFAPDNETLAAILETVDGMQLEFGGKQQQVFESISDLQFHPSENIPVFIGEKDEQKHLVKNGEFIKSAINLREPLFSPDGTSFAYAYREGMDWYVQFEEHTYGPYDNAAQLVFSPDSQRLAFTCQRGDDYFVVIDGEEQSFYDGVGQPIFSPDSQRTAYVARRMHKKFLQSIDAYFMVVDGQEKKNYSAIGQSGISFSADSQRLAYKAQIKELHFVVVDDNESTMFDGIGANTPLFSPDSRHVAFVANFQRKSAVVIDEDSGEEFSAVVLKGGGKLHFEDHRLRYLASRKSEIFLIEERLEE